MISFILIPKMLRGKQLNHSKAAAIWKVISAAGHSSERLPGPAGDDSGVDEIQLHHSIFVNANVVEQERAFEKDAVVMAKSSGGQAVIAAPGVRYYFESVRQHVGHGFESNPPPPDVKQHLDRRRTAELDKCLGI